MYALFLFNNLFRQWCCNGFLAEMKPEILPQTQAFSPSQSIRAMLLCFM
jgi:hypothetical protein